MTKRYLSDYTVVEENGKKRLVYGGTLYHADMSASALKRAKVFFAVNALAGAALYIGMGFAGAAATRALYAGLPYALLIIPSLYTCVDAGKFLRCGGMLERMYYEGSFLHMLYWAVLAMALSAAVFTGGIVYLLRTPELPAGEYFFTPLALFMFASALLMFRKVRAVKSKIVGITPPENVS